MKERLKLSRFALTALLLVVAIVAAGAWLAYGRHDTGQAGRPSSATAPAQAQPQSQSAPYPAGSGEPAASDATASAAPLPPRKLYPAGHWDMAVPFLNPFGAQAAYDSVTHIANGTMAFRYIDRDNIETARTTSGEGWQMQVPAKGLAGDAFDDLARYAQALGGESYPADRDRMVIHARDRQGNDWWGMATRGGGGYQLLVYKELRLRDGQPITFRPADFKDGTVHFTTANTGHRYQSIKVALPDGELQMVGAGTYLQGRYRRDLHYVRSLYAYKSQHYALDDIPQDTSTPLLWTVSWNPRHMPSRIVFTLDEGEAISPVHDGERLGALKVRGATLGRVRVQMSDNVSMDHPELDLTGDRTPEGDTLFWLPSGYWNVIAQPHALKADVDTLDTRLVPVSAGEMTVVDIHPLVDHAYQDPAVGDAAAGENELRILDTSAQGDTGKIAFMLLNAGHRALVPDTANTQVLEGGQPARITALERLRTPPSLVLVLDSSGSMKASMKNVLASARAFIHGLPDNTHLQLIDFDSSVRVLEGTTRAQAIANLGRIRANGSTTLYDAVMKGLTLLKDQERPTLVVFTDGVDSREDHHGVGSAATRSQVEKAVQASGVPLFTIGFGPGHDGSTLRELAGMSSGTYYSADDATALDRVFASINARVGNHYQLTYQRPASEAPSDLPVISLTTDISFSMDLDPATGPGNYRIDKVKNLYHEFVRQLPANSLMQLITFSGNVNVSQVFTHRKPELLQALGDMVVRPGTDILASTKKTYESLKNIPSDKRVIVYLTDAALDVDKADKPAFEKLLTAIKDDGIQSLWVGVGTREAEPAFRWAAEKSGGSYVISEDPAVLAKAFSQTLARVQHKRAARVALSLSVRDPAAAGGPGRYADSRLVDFPPRPPSSDKVALNAVTYRTGLPAPQYGKDAATLVYGRDVPSEDVRITRRLKVDASGKNKAMEWSVRKVWFMRRFKGIDAPSGQSFMAVDMALKNIHPEGVPYLIPDFTSHFFVSLNHAGSYPASPATWLAATPLAAPGENSVTIAPDETRRGVVIFRVPDHPTTQAAVNFYDTSNGHITLPLVGQADTPDIALTSLPKGIPGRLSDTFSMALTASEDVDHIQDVAITDKTSVFKVVEARMDSRVQADLHLNPRERVRLAIQTPAGPFMVPINDVTALLPYGFLWPVTMGPGSSNAVRMAFQTPNVLKDAPMQLYVDLAGGAVNVPVSGAAPAAVAPGRYQGEGMALSVNALVRAPAVGWAYGDYVVADVTVTNTRPGSGVSGLRDAFSLVAPGDAAHPAPYELAPDTVSDRLLLGIDRNWTVFEGTARRGLLVFKVPTKLAGRPLTLQSPQFAELKQPVAGGTYAEPGLLVQAVSPPQDQRFEHALALALSRAISEHRALLAASQPAAGLPPAIPGAAKQAVPAPLPIVYGLRQLQAVKTLADVQALMHGLRWLPSPDHYWNYRNAPASVVTQGWGTEGDLANLAGGLLAKLGYSPLLRLVSVTDRGRAALQALGHVDQARETTLPAWRYTDEQGRAHIFVVPFMRDLSELDGLVWFPGDQEDRRMTAEDATISVYFQVSPRQGKGVGAMAGTMADALTGATSSAPANRDVRVLRTTLALDQLGREPLDIRAGAGKDGYTAVLENRSLQIPGDQTVDPHAFKVTGMRIEVALPGRQLVHETTLRKDEDISGVFHTLALNLPDLPEAAASALQRAGDHAHRAAARPDEHSALIWYTRSILYRFVANQTRYEDQLAWKLGVTAGRTDRERALLVTVRRANGSATLRTSVDLMQSANQLHHGDVQAMHAFNLLSGLFASRLEGAVLPGNKADFMDVWQRSPDGTKLFLSLPYRRREDLEYMQARGFPARLIQRAKDTRKALLIPDRPTRIYGQDRWEWLEIDPQTYETIAVADTGEHGSFADYLMALEPVAPSGDDYLAFMAGAFIGVDTSVWSISSFSLQMSDYDAIIKAAKAYTYGIGAVLNGMMNMKDLAKLEYGVGSLKVSLGAANFDNLADLLESVKHGAVKGDFLGFSQGFAAGAAYYFKLASPPPKPKPKH